MEIASLAGARKRFGPRLALDGLDLDVRPGELLALLGPNGAGKTTAIGLLVGLIAPDAGTATLFGRPPRELAARRQRGVRVQAARPPPGLGARGQVDLVAGASPAPLAPDAALARAGIAALAGRPYGQLSAGQKRQVQLAMALCGRPRLLVLDEPS